MEKNINNMTIKMPHQCFINGEFVDAEGGKTYKSINPTDGTVGRHTSIYIESRGELGHTIQRVNVTSEHAQ